MNSSEIRKRFLAFFEKRGHAIIPSASLVTPDEKGVTNATLFNTAGMQPLVPFLLGKPHPLGTRLADAQKCLRTVDIDDVGDKTHNTFFEMLGNWSLGDYFKKEAIAWSYEFLTSKSEGLGLDPKRLYVSVFAGDENAPRDDEAAAIWQDVFKKHGIDFGGDTSKGATGRIFFMPAKNNWWEAGDNGPCGPDSEMFYDVANKFGGRTLSHAEYVVADDVRDVLEVWNDVFMQYEKKDGKIVGKLPKPSVDTGAGLERLTLTLQGVDSAYDTDLLKPVKDIAAKVCADIRGQRIIADHVRASIMLIADGVQPSNTGRGYILRRLMRRALFNATNQTIPSELLSDILAHLIRTYAGFYDAALKEKSALILKTFAEESAKFSASLADGLKHLAKLIKAALDARAQAISGHDAFNLFQSFGLPLEVTAEIAAAQKLSVDKAAFEAEFKKHQELSRAGAEQKFKGGLADAGDPQVVRYHTATHLLHQALHDVLGDSVGQKGSNITPERLRFDFSHGAKMTDDEKKRVEAIVNEKIAAKLPVNQVTMPKAEAEKTGARHFFGEKYGDQISIYYIGSDLASAYSKEFCGGPHVKNTAELAGPEGKWHFKIQKEEAVSQGVRRIKAVLE